MHIKIHLHDLTTKKNYPNYNDLSLHIAKCNTEERVLHNTTVNHQTPQEVGSTGVLGLATTTQDANLALLATTHQNIMSNVNQLTLIIANNPISDSVSGT